MGERTRISRKKASDDLLHTIRETISDGGKPLDVATQAIMEAGFGHSFSNYQIQRPSNNGLQHDYLISHPTDDSEQQAEMMADKVASLSSIQLDAKEEKPSPDFSNVRIHTGATADASARSINAQAYTIGQNIVFASGQYEPQVPKGKRLLAHELAHTLQTPNTSEAHPYISRFSGPEHQDLADKKVNELFVFLQTEDGRKWAKGMNLDPDKIVAEMEQDPVPFGKTIKVREGLELTPGEIGSLMGDHFSTWQELRGAPKEKIEGILKVMKDERNGGKNIDSDLNRASKGDYLKLAGKNRPHFAPLNKEAWKKMHLKAMERAAKAGSDENAFQEALLIDAAGSHFLEDAFAAGHLFDRIKVETAIASHLKNNPIHTQNPEVDSLVALFPKDKQLGLVVKNIHDQMNREGFEISNAKGMKWKTYGDDNLEKSVETGRIASYAVFQSRFQVAQARKGNLSDVSEVLDLLPDEKSIESATEKACDYIPDAISTLPHLINSQSGILETLVPQPFSFVGKSLLESISDPARPKALEEYDNRKQLDPSTPYPFPSLIRFDFDFFSQKNKTDKTLMRKSDAGAVPSNDAIKLVSEVLQSEGQPLDDATRDFMESRLGHDFAKVRVHTDNRASGSAQAIDALAYTVGHDVVFAAGQYQPTTRAGLSLLAHELTHVLQQQGGLDRNSSISKPLTVSDPSDELEKKANQKADQVIDESQNNITQQAIQLSLDGNTQIDHEGVLQRRKKDTEETIRNSEKVLAERLFAKLDSDGITVAVYVAPTNQKGKKIHGAAEFKRQAIQFAADHQALGIDGGKVREGIAMELAYSLPSLLQSLATGIEELLAKYPELTEERSRLLPVQTLAIFTHGERNQLQAGPHAQWIKNTLAPWIDAIAPYLSKSPLVLLYACSTAGQPPTGLPFAEEMRLALQTELEEQYGTEAGVSPEVWGHTTSGHTTANPRLVEFGDGKDSLSVSTNLISEFGKRLATLAMERIGIVPRNDRQIEEFATDAIRRVFNARGREGHTDPMNIYIREIPFIGIDRVWEHISLLATPDLSDLDLTPEASARAAHGVREFQERFSNELSRIENKIRGAGGVDVFSQ